MVEQEQFQFKVKALRVLENEHRYLKYLMNDWFQLVLKFEHAARAGGEGRGTEQGGGK